MPILGCWQAQSTVSRHDDEPAWPRDGHSTILTGAFAAANTACTFLGPPAPCVRPRTRHGDTAVNSHRVIGLGHTHAGTAGGGAETVYTPWAPPPTGS